MPGDVRDHAGAGSGPPAAGVGVVVVTYFSEAVVADCLRSVPAELPVVVVDNASGDGTVEAVRAARPGAEILENGENRGFAAAVNLGMARLGPVDHVLLLNPDARLVPGAVDELVSFMEGHPRAALVSAGVVDPGGAPESASGGREPSLRSTAAHYLGGGAWARRHGLYQDPPPSGAERRDWVAGTAVLARRAAVDEVGTLDESYFLYCEDVDWCRRMRAAGWEVWVDGDARAVHERSSSVDAAPAWVDEHRIGSLDRYYASRHGRTSLRAFRAVRATGLLGRAALWTSAGLITGRAELRARGRRRWRDARQAARPPWPRP